MTTIGVVLAVAVLAAAFFALAEIALLSTSRIRLRQWVRQTMEGEHWVRAGDLVEQPHRLLSPILVGHTLAVVAASFLTARLAVARMEADLLSGAAVAVVLLVSILYLLETTAGAVARARGHQLFGAVSLLLRFCAWLFRPLVVAADALAIPLLRAAGSRPEARSLSGRRALESLLDESERAGVVEPAEREIIAGVFDFGRTPVRAVMKPVEEMVVAPAGVRVGEISELIRTTGYSRIPLHGRRDPRRIVGMVHVFDLLKLDPHEIPHPRSVVLAGPDTACDELLVEMKRRRCHLAVVAEAKQAIGMVTMEDLVEELVGEIRDEHDARAEGRESAPVVDAEVSITEINSKHGTDLPTGEAGTIADLVVAELGRVPRAGEELRLREWAIDVLDATPQRVRRVRLRRKGSRGLGS